MDTVGRARGEERPGMDTVGRARREERPGFAGDRDGHGACG
jgi:hypothetical protein